MGAGPQLFISIDIIHTCASKACLFPYPSAGLLSVSLRISCWTSAHTQHPPPTSSLSLSLTTTPKINLNHSLQLFNPSLHGMRGRGAQGSNGEMEKEEKWESSPLFFWKSIKNCKAFSSWQHNRHHCCESKAIWDDNSAKSSNAKYDMNVAADKS